MVGGASIQDPGGLVLWFEKGRNGVSIDNQCRESQNRTVRGKNCVASSSSRRAAKGARAGESARWWNLGKVRSTPDDDCLAVRLDLGTAYALGRRPLVLGRLTPCSRSEMMSPKRSEYEIACAKRGRSQVCIVASNVYRKRKLILRGHATK